MLHVLHCKYWFDTITCSTVCFAVLCVAPPLPVNCGLVVRKEESIHNQGGASSNEISLDKALKSRIVTENKGSASRPTASSDALNARVCYYSVPKTLGIKIQTVTL